MPSSRVCGRLCLVALCLICAVSAIAQQTETGTIRGTVLDATGAAVAGANVSIASASGAPVAKAATGTDGKFQFGSLAPGTYRVRTEKPGFEIAIREVSIRSGNTAEAGIILQAGKIVQTITVTESGALAPSVVTSSTKTPTPVLDTPQTVDIVSHDVIQSQAALSMEDALRNVAGVSPTLGEGRRDQFNIRGFSAQYDEYIDGVRDDALYFRDLSNIDRVEVIEGAAAALYGRGSSGGLINSITKKPVSDDDFGELSIITGSYGEKRVEGDLDESLAGGKLSGRLTGADEDSGGFRDNFFLNRYTVSPSLLWKPDEGTQILAQLDYLDDHRLPDRGIPSLDGAPAPVRVGTYYGYPEDDFIDSHVLGLALTADHTFDTGWRLHDVFRHSGYDTVFSNTFPAAPENSASGLLDTRGQYNETLDQRNTFNQTEATYEGEWRGVRQLILAGFEAGWQNLNTLQFTGSAPPVALFNPVLTQPVYSAIPSRNNEFTGVTAGLYLQDQLSWRRWRVLIGARHDWYDQKLNDLLPSNDDLARTDQAWSPRLGILYTIRPSLTAYASYSKTFDPSGEGLSLATNNAELKPETTRSLEAGLKSALAGGRLITTLSAFRDDRFNIKTTDPVNPLLLIEEGTQRTSGVELSVSGRVSRRLSVMASYAWMEPVITRSTTVTSGVLLQGKQPGLVPRNSGSLWATYNWKGGFGAGGGVFTVGRQFTSSDDLVTLSAYTRVDATLFYRSRRWEASFNLRNLLNRTYYQTTNSDFQILPGAPVNGLLTLRYRW